AEKFAANDYSLILCARHEKDLASLARSIRDRHPSASIHYTSCDVSKKQELLDFAKWVLNITDAPDVLINNAGAFIQGHAYNEPEGALEQLMETNVYSAYHLSRALIPAMIRRKQGHIFNICSIASLKA